MMSASYQHSWKKMSCWSSLFLVYLPPNVRGWVDGRRYVSFVYAVSPGQLPRGFCA